MIAQRTNEMLEFYKEDIECIYFDNVEELIKKVSYYIRHESKRREISLNGYNRAIYSEYDVVSRASHILKSVELNVTGPI